MATFKYVRIYTGDDGLSHFEDVEVDLSETGDASVFSPTMPVTGLNFRRQVPGYQLDFHPAPRSQFIVNLHGTVEIIASDGESRIFGPGSIMHADDTTGKGHISKAIGDEERLSLFVHLPQ